jgi:hypothetical protein
MVEPEDIFKSTSMSEILLGILLADMLGEDSFASQILDEVMDRAPIPMQIDILGRYIAEHVAGGYLSLAADLKAVFEFRNKVAHGAVTREGNSLVRISMRRGKPGICQFTEVETQKMVELAARCRDQLEQLGEELQRPNTGAGRSASNTDR